LYVTVQPEYCRFCSRPWLGPRHRRLVKALPADAVSDACEFLLQEPWNAVEGVEQTLLRQLSLLISLVVLKISSLCMSKCNVVTLLKCPGPYAIPVGYLLSMSCNN